MDIVAILTILTIIAFIWILKNRSSVDLFNYSVGENFDFLLSLSFSRYYAFFSEVIYFSESLAPYMAIVIALLAYFNNLKKSYWKLAPQKGTSRPLEQHCQQIGKTLGIKNSPIINTVASPDLSPWVVWLGRYHLIVPTGFLDVYTKSDPVTEAVLFHEFAHIKNHDPIKTSLIEVLSIGYIVTSLILISLRIFRAIALWQIEKTTFFMNLKVSILLLLSIAFLAILNRIVLRQREIQADRMAVFAQGSSISLRTALIRFSSTGRSNSPLYSFAGPIRNLNLYERIFRYHPQIKERNLFLFDSEKYLTPSLGIVCAIGFSTTLTVETGLRAMGISPFGTGANPLLSVLSGFIAGTFILVAIIAPALIYSFRQKKKIPFVGLVNSYLLLVLFFCLGAMLGYFFSILPLDPEIFQIQTAWAVVSSSIGYVPRDYIITLSLIGILLFAQLSHTTSNRKNKKIFWTLYILPSVLGMIPIIIWYLYYGHSFTTINISGLSVRTAKTALGINLLYTGFILIFFGRYFNIGQSPEFTWSKGEFAGSPNLHKKLKPVIRSTVFLVLFAGLWIVGYEMSMDLRLKDAISKEYLFESISLPGAKNTSSGYSQFSDNEYRAIFSFPDGWIIEKVDELGILSLNIYDPSSTQFISVHDFQDGSSLTVSERLYLNEQLLFGTNHGRLANTASPIHLETKIGTLSGSQVEINSVNGRVIQMAILEGGPLAANESQAVYEIVMSSDLKDLEESRKIFSEIITSFDFRGTNEGDATVLPEMNLYHDALTGFEFNYPFTWSVDEILTPSDRTQFDLTIQLPEDNLTEWTQIKLQPQEESRSRIFVNFRPSNDFIDPTQRIERWQKFQSVENPNVTNYSLIASSSPIINTFKTRQIVFEMDFQDELELMGIVTVLSNNKGTFNVTLLCDILEQSECNLTYDSLIRSLQIP